MKSIVFLRHAESVGNAGLPTSDPAEIPLTQAGKIAAEEAANDYTDPPPDLIVVSPFRRARETSEPFIKRFQSATVEEWPVQEFTYLSPARCSNTTSTDRLPLVEAYWKLATANKIDGPGAESFEQFIGRVHVTLERLCARPEQAILVICHEMFIKAAMWLETEKSTAEGAPQRFRAFAVTFAIPNLGRWTYPALPLAFPSPTSEKEKQPDYSGGNDGQDRRALDHLIRDSLAYNTGQRVRELFKFIGEIPYHSPYNAMLLHIQKPEARLVLSHRKWSELGRKVRVGARPLVILATMGPVSFVFDESDTDGAPLPPIPEQGNLFADSFAADGTLPPNVWNRLNRACEKIGVQVTGGDGRITKAGQIENRTKICVLKLNPNHSQTVQFVTLAHELGHLFCGHLGHFKGICQDSRFCCRATAETEAEAVAYLVAKRFGVRSHSERYISAFADGAQFSLDAILVAGGKIGAMCEGTFRIRSTP